MGFGFVVARFGLFLRELGAAATNVPVRSTGFTLWAGTALVLAGVCVNVVSAVQHSRTIRQLNDGQDVTGRPSTTGIALSMLLAAVGLGMSVYLLVFR
jgi:putative membrane protein